VKQKPSVLFSILNWGLGHASRSIPIIKYLQEKGYDVIVCSDGNVLDFIQKEVQATFEKLPPYNMHYRFNSMSLNMIFQSPKLFLTYLKEKRSFRKLEKKYKPVFCISDNRFGCIAKHVPNYFIGHQWNILGPSKKKHGIASKINQHFIKKFDELLIPDDPVLNISGILTTDVSHSFHAMGILSRFSNKDKLSTDSNKYQALAILSGPEPKRTSLENKLISYFESQQNHRFALIRGTDKKLTRKIPQNVTVHNIVDKTIILDLVYSSEVTICRSGYSSVMDFLALDLKRIIFVPTQGQTEQEYLAERLRVFHGYESLMENECTVNNLEQLIEKIRELEATERTKIVIDSQLFHKTIDKLIAANS
jgi:uncharacterized protein (TIGR00661 family)